MAKRYVVLWMAVLILISSFAVWVVAQDQDQNSVIRVVVAMVQLNVAVIDGKGNRDLLLLLQWKLGLGRRNAPRCQTAGHQPRPR